MNTNKLNDEVLMGRSETRNRGVIDDGTRIHSKVAKLQKCFGAACRSSESNCIRVNSCSLVVRLLLTIGWFFYE